MQGPTAGTVLIPMAILWLTLRLMRIYPQSWWSRLLRSAVGPSLAAESLTRRECLRSAGAFTVIALLAFATIALLLWLGVKLTGLRDPFDEPVVGVLLFTYFIVGLTALGGALYMLARAPFRPTVMSSPQEHGSRGVDA
jgi:hypothetical protein